MKLHISIKVETQDDDDFAEYESEDLKEWDDVEAFVGSTRRAVERAQAIAENVIPEEDESLCGKPENHDGGETDGCVECGAIKAGI